MPYQVFTSSILRSSQPRFFGRRTRPIERAARLFHAASDAPPRRAMAGSDTLTPQEIEALGLSLMRLEETVHEMAGRFGLKPEDLNLDLGPLGRLV